MQDLSGEPTDFAPEWSGSLVARYTAQLSQNYAATFEDDTVYRHRLLTSNATNDPLSEVPGYVYVDARITLAAIGRNWGVDLIGKNLTDKIIPIPQPEQLRTEARAAHRRNSVPLFVLAVRGVR